MPSLAVAAEEEAVVVGDRDDERRVVDQPTEVRLVGEDVVRMRRERVGDAGQPADDPRRERGVVGPVRVDVVEPQALRRARVAGGDQDRQQRAREVARGERR